MQLVWWVLALVLAMVTGCIEAQKSVCALGLVCPEGYVCDDEHHGCARPGQFEACAGKAQLEACDHPTVTDGACYEGVCLPAGCGNRAITAPEVCDDGNRDHGDGCSADCLSTEECGNGVIDVVKGEACDDGNTNDGDECHANCTRPICGDGIVDKIYNEACDDGAANSLDVDAACRPNCQPKRCGDNVIDTGERCDDGNVTTGDGCSGDCQSDEQCGNGHVDLIKGESCDLGAANSNAADAMCRSNCQPRRCGDGIIDPGSLESCDLGAANSLAPDAACRPNCQVRRCGDGVADSDEICDDGGTQSGDGCSFDCDSNETCGNNYRDAATEQCDDGDSQNHDGCGTCLDEQPRWHAATGATPTERSGHAMAYDAARGAVLMFGGGRPGTGAVAIHDDTWRWDGAAWRDVTPGGSSPAPRFFAAMAFDTTRDRIVLFGGIDNSTMRYNDTWEWSGVEWVQRTLASGNPPARSRAALAYDVARRRIVLFGGDGVNGSLTDTWEWDGLAWVARSPSTSPSAGGAMTYDPRRGRVVLLTSNAQTWTWDGTNWSNVTPAGGNAPGGGSVAYDAGRDRVVTYRTGATWEFDGTTWANVSPVGTSPPTLTDHVLSYDLERRQVVLFGGHASPALRAITWAWDGATWRNVSPLPPIPLARSQHASAFDSARGRLVVFGGAFGSTVSWHGDTWEWDGTSWHDVTPPTGSPTPRRLTALAYDSARGRVVLFGGIGAQVSGTQLRNDTWEWDGVTWTNVTPAAGNPGARAGHAMVFDSARSRVLMHGGGGASGFNDTWEWDGTSWTNVTPASGNPSSRSAHAMAYDSARNRVVMYGGLFGSFIHVGETWEWNGSSWSDRTPFIGNPAPRAHHAMAYDPTRGRVVMFGGSLGGGQVGADTWEWNGADWSSPLEILDRKPPARMNHTLAFDATAGHVVAFGGYNGINPPFLDAALYRDTWAFDGNEWTEKTPEIARPRVRDTAMSYDAGRGQVVLFGGERDETELVDDTWLWDGRAWSFASPANAPPARGGHALAYDADRDRLVLFGGRDDTFGALGDTWEWDGTTWEDKTPASGSPAPRMYHAMTYDRARQKVLLFGGDGASTFGDTWEWDGASWTEVVLAPGAAPPARYWHAMAYDARRATVVLFGGTVASDDTADTWEWNGAAWTEVTTAVSPPASAAHSLVFDHARGQIVLAGLYSSSDPWEWDGLAWRVRIAATTAPEVRWYPAVAYDDARSALVRYGGEGALFTVHYDTWTMSFANTTTASEACVIGLDGDGDGVATCADDDCFAYCTPQCNPTIMTCDPAWPRCGDGTCQAIESPRLCPGDCGVPLALCGDMLCDAAESLGTCPGDCTP